MEDRKLKINTVKYLYHGTNREFDTFDFKKAKPFKDFGRGFYLTNDFAQAQRWAQIKSAQTNKAYVYRYTVEPVTKKEWKILELLQYDKKWVDFISRCRIKGMETDYDIIYDRMADSRAENLSELLHDYIENKASSDEIIHKIKWSDTSQKNQYCFKNENALQLLGDRETIVLTKTHKEGWKIEERKR